MRALIILILIIYCIYLFNRFWSRITHTASSGSNHRNMNGGNIHVDKNPNKGKKHFEGGEYVDYEEVK